MCIRDRLQTQYIFITEFSHNFMVAERHRAKLQAEQSIASDVTSPLSDLEHDEVQGHFKDASTDDQSSGVDAESASAVESKERGEADDAGGSRDAMTSRDDPVIVLTLTELEVITEGELLDVSMSPVMGDFRLEMDWQRKPELEIPAACALP